MAEVRVSKTLRTERLPDGRRKLLRPLTVNLGYLIDVDHRLYPGVRRLKGCTVITVPEDSETDFSSVPRFARFFMRWDRVDIAGVLHDHLYGIQFPRRQADIAWRTVARAGQQHLGPVAAYLGFAGLRVGGWAAWDSESD